MSVSVTATYSCGGCNAAATSAPQPVRREFVSLSGRDYGVGTWQETVVDFEACAPEGWMPFDPFTGCCYCRACWASIEAGVDAEVAQMEER